MANKDFENSTFEITHENRSLKYQIKLKDDKLIILKVNYLLKIKS